MTDEIIRIAARGDGVTSSGRHGIRSLAGREQERFNLIGLGAELGSQAQLRMLIVHLQAHEQVEIARGDALGRRRTNDLLQLLQGVEAESLHAM